MNVTLATLDSRGLLPPSGYGEQNLLLVEDEGVARRHLAEILGDEGFQIQQASTGQDAVEQARSTGHGIVVLMDIRMKGEYNGIEAARLIKQIDPTASIIFVTAYADDREYRDQADTANLVGSHWIEKPIKTQALIDQVQKELIKVRIRTFLKKIRGRGMDANQALRVVSMWNQSIPKEIFDELGEELDAAHKGEERQTKMMMKLEAEVDQIYADLAELVARPTKDSETRRRIEFCRRRLRSLQGQEAAIMEQRAEARLHLKTGEGDQLRALAERLLRK